jgi:hypothetical protein
MALVEGTACTFSAPALNPWGMLRFTPLETDVAAPVPPVLLKPATPVTAAGAPLRLAAEDSIQVRQTAPGIGAWKSFTEDLVIDRDMTIEARTVNSDGVFSPASRWRFWAVAQPAVKALPVAGQQSLLPAFKKRSQTCYDTFPDGAPLLVNGQRMTNAFGTIGEVELSAALPEDAAYFGIGIAIADDAEVLRPSYRVEVYTDDGFLYETPIYNPVKGLVHAQEPGRRDLQLALPRGTSEISLKLCGAGWFGDHNRVVWIDPTVWAGRHLITDKHRDLASRIASGNGGRTTQTQGKHDQWTGGEQ